jgi:hypothetical protein
MQVDTGVEMKTTFLHQYIISSLKPAPFYGVGFQARDEKFLIFF